MTDAAVAQPSASAAGNKDVVARGLKARRASEARFKGYGIAAIAIAIAALCTLLYTILSVGYSAFFQTRITLEVEFSQERIDPENTGDPAVIGRGNFLAVARDSIYRQFPDVTARRDRRALAELLSSGSDLQLREMVLADPSLIGTTQEVSFIADDMIDMFKKGRFDREAPEDRRPISDQQIAWYDQLDGNGAVSTSFNTLFLSKGDSRNAELAGVWGAAVGSFYTLLVTLILAFPIGVSAAIYLEEFAPKNKITDLIEVNINNLAAVPSIVFGLLGLAVLLNFFGLPRSTPLVGGMVLALMTLPTVIIASRAALKAVPPSIREAALGMGASPVQTVTHHVLPLALPGILTGTIIGMAQALGETAPLLMIGMVAFIVDIPQGPLSAATALPVQVYLWSDTPERAFVERTSAAIMVLLTFLIIMNLIAVVLRKRFERRW